MKKLPKINTAQVVKAGLPYLIIGLLATKLGESYRLTTGADILDKVLRVIIYFKAKNAKKYRHGEEYDTARLTLGKIADPEKRNVDRVLPAVSSYEEFLTAMRQEGYEIQTSRNILSFRLAGEGKERFNRTRTLGPIIQRKL